MAKAKKKKTAAAPPLSHQIEQAIHAGLAKIGIKPEQVAREHAAVKAQLKKLDAAAGKAASDLGARLGALGQSVRKKTAKKKPVAKKAAAKKTVKRKATAKKTAKRKTAK